MRILKIYLQNIKSYEDGPVIELHQGVNFISGKNGSGKTTILEAIGYAIFDYCLYTDISKMLREGTNKGKITVWFSFDDDIVYRSERKMSTGNRTWTIFEEGDDTEIVSGVKEVKEWIREKIGVPEEVDISKMYSDIIGVSQGEITTYFKITSETKRKDHFNPIIGVEDYREAFKKTSTIPSNISLRIKDIEGEIKEIKARTEKYDEKKEELEGVKKELEQIKKESSEKNKEFESKQKELGVAEKLRDRLNTLENKTQVIKEKIGSTDTNLIKAKEELANSKKAKSVIKTTKVGFEAYETANKQFNELSKKSKLKRDLEKKKNEVGNQLKSLEAEIKTSKLSNIKNERDVKLKLEAEKSTLKTIKKPYESLMQQSNKIEEEIKLIKNLETKELEDLNEKLSQIKQNNNRIHQIETEIKKKTEKLRLANKDLKEVPSLEELKKKIDSLKKTIQSKDGEKTVFEEKIASYKTSITKGGICPILNESCDRVSKKVLLGEIKKLEERKTNLESELYSISAELAKLEKEKDEIIKWGEKRKQLSVEEKEISDLSKEVADLKSLLNIREVNSLLKKVVGIFKELNHPIKIATRIEKKKLEEDLSENIHLIKAEIKEIFGTKNKRKTEIERDKSSYETKSVKSNELIQSFESDLINIKESDNKIIEKENEFKDKIRLLNQIKEELKPHLNLERELASLQKIIEKNKQKSSDYIKNVKEANLFEKRDSGFKELVKLLKKYKTEISALNKELMHIKTEFKEENYQKLKNIVEQLRVEKTKFESKLQEFETNNKKLIDDLKQMDAELTKINKLEKDKVELIEVSELTSFIRDVLNMVGKPIAQRYLNTISISANMIYNTLSDEKVELIWEQDYMIRIKDHNGIREFPQLSGGEQMCAALSIQLALAKEFSNVGMAIFDEPTSNLDETRCDFLSDTIAKVRDEYGFNQLFIISHDETFSSLTEQEIHLEKVKGRTQLV